MIYVVTQGNYSSYRICDVFTTRKKAKDYISRCSINDGRIESYRENPIDNIQKDLKQFTVLMKKDGNCDVSEGAHGEKLVFLPQFCWGEQLFIVVWAKDKAHAEKIANEYRTRILAEPEDLWILGTKANTKLKQIFSTL